MPTAVRAATLAATSAAAALTAAVTAAIAAVRDIDLPCKEFWGVLGGSTALLYAREGVEFGIERSHFCARTDEM